MNSFSGKSVTDMRRWLTDVQGLSAGTLCKNGDAARVFLRWLHEHADVTSLRRLSVNNLDAYLTWRLPDLRRATRMGICRCLRSFLRYLHAAKLIDRDLAAAVSSPSLYRFEDIPRAFTESQIEAVLATTRRDRSASRLARLRDAADARNVRRCDPVRCSGYGWKMSTGGRID